MKYSKSTGGFYSTAIHGSNIPPDAVDISDQQYAALIAGQASGKSIQPNESGFPILRDHTAQTQLTDEQLALESVAEMQRRMDTYAKSWGYDDIKSAVGYVGDPFPQFDAEGVVLRNWRSTVWQWARIQESLVVAGTIQRPSSPAEFADGMPAAPTRPVA